MNMVKLWSRDGRQSGTRVNVRLGRVDFSSKECLYLCLCDCRLFIFIHLVLVPRAINSFLKLFNFLFFFIVVLLLMLYFLFWPERLG